MPVSIIPHTNENDHELNTSVSRFIFVKYSMFYVMNLPISLIMNLCASL